MPPHRLCPRCISPGTVSNPEYEHAYSATLQDAAFGNVPTAASTHIASMIESLDDLLAGEDEIPTVKEEPYDEDTLDSKDELDPVIVV